jgi:hypothetical protein
VRKNEKKEKRIEENPTDEVSEKKRRRRDR